MSKFLKVLNLDEATRVDTASSSITYIGKALVGSATSSSVWKISQLNSTSGVVITYAGTGSYDQIWDNRASLIYS